MRFYTFTCVTYYLLHSHTKTHQIAHKFAHSALWDIEREQSTKFPRQEAKGVFSVEVVFNNVKFTDATGITCRNTARYWC